MPRAHTSPAHLRPSCCAHPHSTARCPRWRQTISSRVRPRSASPDPPSHTGHIYLRIASPMGSLLRPPRVPHSVTTSYDFSRLFHTLVARPARPPWRPSSAAGHHATRPPIGYRPGTYGPPGGGRDALAPPPTGRPPLGAQSEGPRRAVQSHTQLCFSSSVYSLRFVLPAIGFGFVGARTRIPDSSSPLFYSPVYAYSVPLGYLVRARGRRARASAACRIYGGGNVLYCTSLKK